MKVTIDDKNKTLQFHGSEFTKDVLDWFSDNPMYADKGYIINFDQTVYCYPYYPVYPPEGQPMDPTYVKSPTITFSNNDDDENKQD